MSSILYYSNFCDNCKKILQIISASNAKSDIHFINIDKRIKKNNATYIVLENGQEILLPPTITKVPSLLLLNKGHHVLFGSDLNKYIESTNVATVNPIVKMNGEPMAYMLNNSGCGVRSDYYSFLDQGSDDLSAKGNGGMRQQHHYAGLTDNTNSIDTPPDSYQADTIGQVTLEQLQKNRESDIKR